MKQTSAVEFLLEKYKSQNTLLFAEDFEQAKEMHKKDIEIAHLMGLITSIEMEATKQAEQYYAELYGK
jgi:hypothetical protein